MLAAKAEKAAERVEAPKAKTREDDADSGFGQSVKDACSAPNAARAWFETMAKQTARTVGSQIGRQILRGVLGGIFGGSRR
jgi:hypothetical protein